MFHRYDYEAEYYPKLTRLPLDVRRKLDVTGIKISLKDWLSFSLEERSALCHLPCDNDEERQVFAAYLDFLAGKYCGKPADKTDPMNSALWSALTVPDEVAQKSAALGASSHSERVARLAVAPSLRPIQVSGVEESTGSLRAGPDTIAPIDV